MDEEDRGGPGPGQRRTDGARCSSPPPGLASRRCRRRCRRSAACRRGRCARRPVGVGDGDLDGEHRTLTRDATVDPGAAAVGARPGRPRSTAPARPLPGAGLAAAVEAVEDLGRLLGVEAGPLVGHPHHGDGAVAAPPPRGPACPAGVCTTALCRRLSTIWRRRAGVALHHDRAVPASRVMGRSASLMRARVHGVGHDPAPGPPVRAPGGGPDRGGPAGAGRRRAGSCGPPHPRCARRRAGVRPRSSKAPLRRSSA